MQSFQEDCKRALLAQRTASRKGKRNHRKDYHNPIEGFIAVTVRGRTIHLRNSIKVLEVWVPKEGDVARQTIEWIIAEVKKDSEKVVAGAVGRASQEEPSQEPRGGTESAEEECRRSILDTLRECERCEAIWWMPSRGSFRYKVVGGDGKVHEVRVKNWPQLQAHLRSGGSLSLMKERYGEVQQRLEDILGLVAAAPPEDPPQPHAEGATSSEEGVSAEDAQSE